MIKLNENKTLYSIIMFMVSILLALNFVFYTISERRIDQSYEERISFHLLADELKTSSDDLTRMVRTYAATKDPIYGEYYRRILDIREGRSERPSVHDQLYWNFMTDPDRRVSIDLLPPQSLLSRIRNFGLENPELQLLEDALIRSNSLTSIEWKAIDLLDQKDTSSHELANVLSELHGDEYHRQKAMIMRSIHQFYHLVEKRLSTALEERKDTAFILRNTLVGLIILLIAMVFNMRLSELKLQKKEAEDHQRLLNQQNAILAIVSHDLRNPVAAIKAHLDLIKENDGELSERTQKILSRIGVSSNTLLYLLNDLMIFTDIENPQFKLQKETSSINAMIAEQLTLFEPEAKRKNIRFQFSPTIDLHLSIDPNRLNQVLSNLISNALKYSPSSSLVAITLDYNLEYACISVKDQGPGIAREEQQELFKPFKTLSTIPTAGEPKTGLGLYICKKIVEAHGGKIEAISSKGKGSTFTINLPRNNLSQ